MRHADLLAQIPLFEGLSDEDREGLGQRLTERKFAPGEGVFRIFLDRLREEWFVEGEID